MTEKDLEELEGLPRRATPAPWSSDREYLRGPDTYRIGDMDELADAVAIAALVNAAPSLLAEVREARRLLGEARNFVALQAARNPIPHNLDALARLDAFLAGERSDREQSEPTESNSEGSNPIAAPTKEDR